jgi:hypothetical protein
MPIADFLRFSVMYGLDGVMKDILHGKYGEVGNEVTIDSTLQLDDKPFIDTPSFNQVKLFYPPYAMGAILGHENIVVAALNELGAKWDVQVGGKTNNDEESIRYSRHILPSDVFLWAFNMNSQTMIKCLVKCGFQFRWIHHKHHMPVILKRIFEISLSETSPKWTDIDEEELIFENSIHRRYSRATYKLQMKMLDLLINLGLPFELLYPVEPPIERDVQFFKEVERHTSDQIRAHLTSFSKEEQLAMKRAGQACTGYSLVER